MDIATLDSKIKPNKKPVLLLLPALLLALTISDSVLGQTYTIHTVAGGGLPENVTGTSAVLSRPTGVAADALGNVFITSSDSFASNVVLRLDASTGLLTRVAGTWEFGYSGDNGPAASAQLNFPGRVAVDTAGNLYIPDTYNYRVRKVSNGLITTVAGTGTQGFSGDGGLATSAQLYGPTGVAADAAGNLYIADGARIRKVSNGVITTVAGNGTLGFSGDNGPATSAQIIPSGVAVDVAGNLYIAEYFNNRVRKISNGQITTVAGNGTSGPSGDNGPATSASLDGPNGVAVDGAGNLYIADTHSVRKVSNGLITTVVGTSGIGYSGDDNWPATDARIGAYGVAVDASGSLYIADMLYARIRKVSNGVIFTVAGNGSYQGPATSAHFLGLNSVAVDASGNLYISDWSNPRIGKVLNGVITTVAGNGTSGWSGDNGPAISAQLGRPSGVAVDAAGNLYIADGYGGGLVRKVSGGVITTVAGNQTWGYSGDNGPATSAQLDLLSGVAVDAADNLYIADGYNYPYTGNRPRIRKVSNGVITTVAGNGTEGFSGDNGPGTSAQLYGPRGVAAGAAGNFYIAETYRIRKVSNGVITTVAGNGTLGYSGDNGPATTAQLNQPSGVAADSDGNVYIADTSNHRIRRVSGGVITTIAGTGQRGFAGDDGPATSAQLYNPWGIAVDAAGNVYIADSGNGRVRVLTPSGPSCTYSASPLSSIVGAAGGSIIASIQTGSSCLWAISGLPGWITVSGTATGAGPTTATLAVAANLGGPRLATVSIAGIPVTITQDATPASSGPTITAVTNAATGNVQTIQRNSWVTIWGSNLAPANSGRTWQSQDIVDGKLPTSLDGVSVTINGKPAFVQYISPGQLNVLAPDDDAAGPVNVIVTNQGVASTPFPVQLQTHSPAFFTFSPPNQQYLAAVFPYKPDNTFDAYLAPAGALGAGVPSRPAKPGDILQLYGTGFGPTNPKPPVGQVFFGPYPTETPVIVTIGGILAEVNWAGISAAGVYQLNVTVPQAVPDGDARVVATVGGVETQGGVFIPIQR